MEIAQDVLMMIFTIQMNIDNLKLTKTGEPRVDNLMLSNQRRE
jgi:hypothetical protein